MNTHCDSCGCLLRFKAKTMSPSLAPRSLWTKLARASESERESLRAEIKSYGHRTSWHLSHTCTGCGTIGTWFEEYTQADAKAREAEQNARLETPEAKQAAEHWEDEVARRIAEESRHFAALFGERFPTWPGCLEQRAGEGLRVSIPSENVAVSEPLQIEVKNGEVLIWWLGGWHVHVFRRDSAAKGSLEHLHEALSVIAQLTNEELVTTAYFVEGKPMGGGTLFPSQEIEWRGKIDTMQLRSWRGSHDRIVTKPESSSD